MNESRNLDKGKIRERISGSPGEEGDRTGLTIGQLNDERRLRDRDIADDIFIMIGTGIAFVAISSATTATAGQLTNVILLATLSWGFAEFITRYKTYLFSLTALLAIFAHSSFGLTILIAGHFVDLISAKAYASLTMTFLAVLAYCQRFRLAYSYPLIAVSLLLIFIGMLAEFWPNYIRRNVETVSFFSGIFLLIVGTATDFFNQENKAAQSNLAFACHVTSSPLIFCGISLFLFSRIGDYAFIFFPFVALLFMFPAILIVRKSFLASSFIISIVIVSIIFIASEFNMILLLFGVYSISGFIIIFILGWQRLQGRLMVFLPERVRHRLPGQRR